MSIRLVDGCGSLPTSLKEGNLIIYGYDKKIVTVIKLPFKTKFNGPYSTEFIKYPNVMVLAPTDSGGYLVMRYDGTYTLYTPDMRPIGFGNYDTDIIMSQVYIDVFGSYSEIPPGMKKPRLYEAYLIRYKQSQYMHYTCAYQRWVKEICNLNDKELVEVFMKGLNLGIKGYPMLGPIHDCLLYDERIIVPCNDIDLTMPEVCNKLLYTSETGYEGFNVLARRCPYGELTRYVQESFKPPEYIKEMLDVVYLSQPDRSFSGREKETILYQMACTMNRNQNLIFACEVSSFVYFTVDDTGIVRNHRIHDIRDELVDYDGQLEISIAYADSKYNMCGYVNTPVMEISEPTVIPRLAHYDGKVYKGDNEILLPQGIVAARRPDVSMKGYIDCVREGKSFVMYTEGNDSIIL